MRQSRTISLPEGQYHSLRSKEYHSHIKQRRESFTEICLRVTLSSVFIASFAFVLQMHRSSPIPFFYFSDKDIRLTESGFIFEPKMNNFPKNIDKIVTLCYTLGENHNRGAADMTNTEGTLLRAGKGRPPRMRVLPGHVHPGTLGIPA